MQPGSNNALTMKRHDGLYDNLSQADWVIRVKAFRGALQEPEQYRIHQACE